MCAKLRLSVALAAMVLLALPTALLGDDLDELRRLEKQYNAHRAAGRYRQAESIAKRIVKLAEKSFQNKPAVMAAGLNNLAILYRAQRKYAEAEPLHKRSLAIWEKALGPEHPNVATGLNNLANLYSDWTFAISG